MITIMHIKTSRELHCCCKKKNTERAFTSPSESWEGLEGKETWRWCDVQEKSSLTSDRQVALHWVAIKATANDVYGFRFLRFQVTFEGLLLSPSNCWITLSPFLEANRKFPR